MSGGSLVLNREYSGEYSLGSASGLAWRRLKYARMWINHLLPWGASAARRLQWQNFRRHVWATSCSDEADFCTNDFVWMTLTLWNDQKVFLTTLKKQMYPNNASIFWRTRLWYQLLVGETTGGGFETLRGDKTHCFISKQQAYKKTNKNS